MPDSGYHWWYVDALSHDSRHGLVIIGFVGSVFSPYYALARRRGSADPDNHCAINVALYGPLARWCMTERGKSAVSRTRDRLAVGPSSMAWDGDTLVICVDEISVPFPQRLRGEVRLTPQAFCSHQEQLDKDGHHVWRPIAAQAHVEVRFDIPDLQWSGSGYHDLNYGDIPLERSFRSWNWSRAAHRGGAHVLYDVERLDGTSQSFALRFAGTGAAVRLDLPPRVDLGKTAWRMPRVTRSERTASIQRTLEDTPFYARSLVETHISGEPVIAVHESLSLDRFRLPIVQAMLPFRMPRRAAYR